MERAFAAGLMDEEVGGAYEFAAFGAGGFGLEY